MFTNITASYNNGDVLIEAACLSTDTKPTDGIANGSACIEMDTGKTFMYDEANGEWIEVNTGGGGGGGGVNLHTATLTISNSPNNVNITLSNIDGTSGYINYIVPPSDGNYVVPLFDNGEGGGGCSGSMRKENWERISTSTTGDVVIEEHEDPETGDYDYYITITGDCSITFE